MTGRAKGAKSMDASNEHWTIVQEPRWPNINIHFDSYLAAVRADGLTIYAYDDISLVKDKYYIANPAAPRDILSVSGSPPLEQVMAMADQQCPQVEGATDADSAFEAAIKAGRLSPDEAADNYAGHYMFMGLKPGTGKALFKHTMTRQCID
jgi:hypothetical protein